MRAWTALAACVLAVAAHAAGPPPAAAFFAHAERGHYRLSADGRRLAWLGRVAGADGRARANVFVQSLRGITPIGRPRQLTHEAARDIPDIAWKGNRTILFRRDTAGDEAFHVIALDADTGALRDLTPGAQVRATLIDDLPDDPGHVLVASNRRDPARDDAWRVDLRTGEAELVAENPGDITQWKTDHRGRVRLALRGDGLALTWLHRADEAADWVPLVTTDFRTDVTPKFFDAEDRRLYALSNRGRDKAALVLIDPAHPADEQVLFEPADVDAADAAWSRARRRLVRVDYVPDRPAHRFFDAGAERMWHRLQARLPGAAITLQDASAGEEKFVVAADDAHGPGTRWLYDARSGALHALGAVNPRLPADRRTTTAPVVYAARDGLAIHGTLTLPAGRPARPIACVVHPHGGPWSRDEWGWNAEVRFLASRGLCVLQMDYRGSTGHGRRFWEAGFRQWGRAMQDDVDDGARWLVAQGIADPKRLAIVGASYGGYVALAAAAFTPGLYAAAVDLAGPVDLATFLDELPLQARAQLPQLAEMIGDPARDDERARLAAVSPARHTEAIAIPLLVAQGANDPRVPAWRVERFVAALRARGVDVTYLRKDDEGHGFRNEENQVEFEEAMAAFLEKHLQAGISPRGP